MSAKTTAICVTLGILLAIAVVGYRVAYLVHGTRRLEGASVALMDRAYRRLCEYHDQNGRWPRNLPVVMGKTGVDLTSDLPLLYFPDAKRGTEAILIAQPKPFEVGPWPFVTAERKGIRADGEVVDGRGDERKVEEAK